MVIMDWKECCSKRIVKPVSKDNDFIRSLIFSSDNKWKSGEKLLMEDVTATSKLSLAYDALRELLEALALSKGYKVYNHECYTAFLKEVMKESSKGDDFDEMRKIRNQVNYYGKSLAVEEAELYIKKKDTLRTYIKKLL